MSSDHLSEQILDLIDETREYTAYLAELGVEMIHIQSGQSAEAHAAQTENLSSRSPSRYRPEVAARQSQNENAPLKPAPYSNPTVREGSKGVGLQSAQDSLFGDLAPEEPSLPRSDETLEDIWRDIGECTRCGLCQSRTQVVNTHGNPKARLMFIGEAPGADEDAQGRPFVGRAGQLLTKIIEAIGMKREEVIIGNVNRCRPPANRAPTLAEAATCRPFLFREVAAVRPDVIVVLGNTALQNLLDTRESIGRLRGKFQDYYGIKVMPTFHPAYLLRDPSKKRETWEDMKKVREYLDSLKLVRNE